MIKSTIYVAVDNLEAFLAEIAPLGMKIDRTFSLSLEFDKVYVNVTCPTLEAHKVLYSIFLKYSKPHSDERSLKLKELLKAVINDTAVLPGFVPT